MTGFQIYLLVGVAVTLIASLTLGIARDLVRGYGPPVGSLIWGFIVCVLLWPIAAGVILGAWLLIDGVAQWGHDQQHGENSGRWNQRKK